MPEITINKYESIFQSVENNEVWLSEYFRMPSIPYPRSPKRLGHDKFDTCIFASYP